MSSLLKNASSKATAKNAREMIIFSYPKVGKTEAFAQLPGNYVIIDFEGGTAFYDCNKIEVNSLEIFNQLRDELVETNAYYNFIVLDTLTSMYANIINSIAVNLYNLDEKKNKPLDWDIDKLGFGKGHIYKRDALSKVKSFFRDYCDCLILAAHVKDSSLDGDNGNINIKDIDVEGKLKSILALKTDAMGLLYRNPENPAQNLISFSSTAGQVGGTRIQHLSNKTIPFSEKLEDGTLVTHWDQIFI
jgi:hypothetical protein